MDFNKIFYKGKYLIRLDDASHYMNLKKWNRLEAILDEYNIKPIVAVIPENLDNKLKRSSYNYKFWEIIKKWENKGWIIAAHGLNHKFHIVNKKSLYYPFYNFTEFGGLSLDVQRDKIHKSIQIFKLNNILPKVWISPAHTFDKNTLIALEEETSIKIISDGISFYPFYENNFHFIPQQLWSIKRKFFGYWTVCLHPNNMTDKDLKSFEYKLKKKVINQNIISLDEINLKKNKKTFFDKFLHYSFWIKYNLKMFFNK